MNPMPSRLWWLVALPALVAFTWPWTATQRTEAGRAAWERGDPAGATAEFEAALGASRERPELLYNLGSAQLAAGQQAAALETLSQVRSSDPQLAAAAHYNRGNALFELEQYEAAAEAYEATLALTPNDADAQHNLALARRRQREREEQRKQQQQQDQQRQQQQQQQQQGQQQGSPSGQSDPWGLDRERSRPRDASPEEVDRRLEQLGQDEQLDRDMLRLRPQGAGPNDDLERELRGLSDGGLREDW